MSLEDRLREALERCAVKSGPNGQRCSLCNVHALHGVPLAHAEDCLLRQKVAE